MANVINDIFTIQEFYITSIKKNVNDGYNRDILKIVL